MWKNKVYDNYERHARGCDPLDFMGQVWRSVRGQAVNEEQVQLIVEAVVEGLALSADDVLLDLCCGNGALSTRFFNRCGGGVGVDFSDYMIDIAKRQFEKSPTQTYVHAEALEFVRETAVVPAFTKALCYGSFAYLPAERVRELLAETRRRFPTIARFFIGNIPDRSFVHTFSARDDYQPGMENDPESLIGLWWSLEDLTKVAIETGWRAEFRRMRSDYFNAHYRFDAILVPG